jgi:uncharacterized membrane protein
VFRRIPLLHTRGFSDNGPSLFNREQIMTFTPSILIHLFTVLGAIVIGGVMLSLRKGTRLHRLSGRIWVVLMLTTALVSFGIKTSGHFSWIHLLSVLVLFSIGGGLLAIYRRKIKMHQQWMTSLYIGTVVAGVFTLLPGRRLGHLVWHAAGLI